VKYGYSNVGHVVEGPDDLVGRAVFCLFPHQTAYVVATSAVVPLPTGLHEARAVLGANMETALNAIWDAPPLAGDRISVVGAGVVGCLVAYLASRAPGANVELVDVNEARSAVARALGVGFRAGDEATGERDLVFHASGTAAGLRSALSLTAKEGSIIELSWFGSDEVALPLGEAFHARRLTLRSSQVGTVSPTARPRFTHRTRLALALELLKDPVLDALLDGDSPFSALPATMIRLSEASGSLCHRIRYDE
jgi:threonine dehydrogenase-like Zn-dependent dehydrogenase